MSEQIREEFEAWARHNGISTVRTPSALMFANGQRRAEGDYIMVESLCAWESWKASRTSLLVELPEAYENDADGHWLIRRAEAKQMIEAQGLKVKP